MHAQRHVRGRALPAVSRWEHVRFVRGHPAHVDDGAFAGGAGNAGRWLSSKPMVLAVFSPFTADVIVPFSHSHLPVALPSSCDLGVLCDDLIDALLRSATEPRESRDLKSRKEGKPVDGLPADPHVIDTHARLSKCVSVSAFE